MSAYRAIITATIVITAGLCAIMFVLNDQGATLTASFILIGIGLLDVAATGYICKLVVEDQRRPRSWLLLFLATGAVFITLGFLLVDFLILRRLAGLPPFPGTGGIVLTSLAIILVGAVPIMKAALFYVVRHSEPEEGDRLEDQT